MIGGGCDSVIKEGKDSTNYQRYDQDWHQGPIDTYSACFHRNQFIATHHSAEYEKNSNKSGYRYDFHYPSWCLKQHNFHGVEISDIILKVFDVLI